MFLVIKLKNLMQKKAKLDAFCFVDRNFTEGKGICWL